FCRPADWKRHLPPSFCRTLDGGRAFFRFIVFPPLFTILTPRFGLRSDFACIFADSRSKGHGADKLSAEFSARISPFDELIRCIERQHLRAGGSIVAAASKEGGRWHTSDQNRDSSRTSAASRQPKRRRQPTRAWMNCSTRTDGCGKSWSI